jgi:hypothetical protein
MPTLTVSVILYMVCRMLLNTEVYTFLLSRTQGVRLSLTVDNQDVSTFLNPPSAHS